MHTDSRLIPPTATEATAITTPSQLPNAADQEFHQHRFTAGADLVWCATYQWVTVVAGNANLPCRNHRRPNTLPPC